MHTYTGDIKKMKPFFEPLKIDYIFDAITESNTEALLFVDDLINPQTLILNEGSAYYFAGSFNLATLDYFMDKVLTKEKSHYIKIISKDNLWLDKLKVELAGYEHHLLSRTLFSHSLETIPKYLPRIKNIEILEISKSLLDKNLIHSNLVIDEIIGEWKDLDNFYQRGFGYLALDGNKIIGWCTCEYKSQNACGIGIEVVESYHQQNIAKSMTSAFLNKARQENITPHWDSWDWNKGSIKTALACGFKEKNNYHAILLSM